MQITLPKPLESFMTQQINANILKYAAGQNIFCPGCNNVMDWRRTVSIDFTGATSNKLHATYTLCATCADKHLPGLPDRLAKAEAKAGEKLTVVTTDGRDYNDDEEYDPAPTPVQGAAVTFRAARRNDPKGEEVTGALVAAGLPDWATFATYQKPDECCWVVELSTGYAFAHADTFKEAVIAGFRRLRSVGEATFRKALAAAPVLNR